MNCHIYLNFFLSIHRFGFLQDSLKIFISLRKLQRSKLSFFPNFLWSHLLCGSKKNLGHSQKQLGLEGSAWGRDSCGRSRASALMATQSVICVRICIMRMKFSLYLIIVFDNLVVLNHLPMVF